MAVRTYSASALTTRGDHCHVISWTGLENGDTGQALEMAGSADRSVQVVGTFGSGGSLLIEGSNDGENFSTLTHIHGYSLIFSSAGLRAIVEPTFKIRPRVTSGDVTTSLSVFMLVRRPAR